MENKVRVFYLRNEQRFPVACVASLVDDNGINYAVATHNPMDVFNKPLGRKIAEGRLASGHGISRQSLPEDKRLIKRQLMKSIMADETLPQRARDAASIWLERSNV